jgi:hypothetical protein
MFQITNKMDNWLARHEPKISKKILQLEVEKINKHMLVSYHYGIPY